MKYRMIDLNTLIIDKRYQRPLDPKRVEKIVNEFDPRLLGTLEVSVRNGKAAIFDGQHRFAALKKMKMDKAPCIAHEGISPEEEAELFVALQTRRRSVSQIDRFRARIFAEDPVAVGVKTVVEDCGWGIATHSHSENDEKGQFRAINTLERLYRQSPETLHQSLDLLQIWHGDRRSTEAPLIEGTFRLIREYGDRVDEDARLSLAVVSPTVILRRALGEAATRGGGAAHGGKAVAVELRKVAGVRGRPMKKAKRVTAV